MSVDLEELAAIIRLLREAEFSEFRYHKGDVSIVVRRGAIAEDTPAPAATAPPVTAGEAAAVTPAPHVGAGDRIQATAAVSAVAGEPVTAPLLGTFYGTPKPGEPPFVRVGDRVEADTVVCIVEVMKLMNSVTAGVAGVVAAIHVKDGELVEHGQALFTIAPAVQR